MFFAAVLLGPRSTTADIDDATGGDGQVETGDAITTAIAFDKTYSDLAGYATAPVETWDDPNANSLREFLVSVLIVKKKVVGSPFI